MSKQNETVEKVLNAESKEELQTAYKAWAGDYDKDLNDEGYMAPKNTVDILQKYITDKNTTILDAGCGTGMVGTLLHAAGYTAVDGLDYSPDMLKVAEGKSVYGNLSQGDLTARLDISDDAYDAIVSVGTFTCAHVGPEAFDELIRITKAGGVICFAVRDKAWSDDNYNARIAELQDQGKWQELETIECDYILQEQSRCNVCVYRVL